MTLHSVQPAAEKLLGMPGSLFGTTLIIAGVALFLVNLSRRLLLLFRSQYDPRFSSLGKRFLALLTDGFLQKKLPRFYPVAGALHIIIFWGFLVLVLRTVELAGVGMKPDFALPFLEGGFGAIYTLVREIFSLLVLLACGGAFYRRAVVKPERYKGSHQGEAYLVLLLIAFLMLSDMTFEGSGLVLDRSAGTGHLGSRAVMLLMSGWSSETLISIRLASYWSHMAGLILFLNLLPFSKHFHVLTALPNVFFRKLTRGEAKPPRWDVPAVEKLQTVGVKSLNDLSWKQILDLYSCTECGRCTDNCPAHAAGRRLSPKMVTMKLRDYGVGGKGGTDGGLPVSGGVITDEEIWGCTTCGSCEEQCPVAVEHVDKIIDMRRYLVGMESRFPCEIENAYRNAEIYGDPQGMGRARRREWASGLKLTELENPGNAEILYWVGCAGAFDERYREVATAFVSLLQKAGVAFSILGSEEGCCGDFARRTGNEYLFQFLARKNIEVLQRFNGKKVVTTCPHCFNALKNEYRQLGCTVEVNHHSEYLLELAGEGRLQIPGGATFSISYHDSCYLGRYNGIYEAPRNLLQLGGAKVVELDRNRERGFCCGAGGGYLWLEEQGKRLNEMRVDNVVAANLEVVATACPFCLLMLQDGIKAREETAGLRVLDIAEFIAEKGGAAP